MFGLYPFQFILGRLCYVRLSVWLSLEDKFLIICTYKTARYSLSVLEKWYVSSGTTHTKASIFVGIEIKHFNN